jgi:hypothetical protein
VPVYGPVFSGGSPLLSQWANTSFDSLMSVAIWRKSASISAACCSFIGFPLICYRFSSCLRSVGEGLGQFWPDGLPVVGAQVATGDCTTGGGLNARAAPDWYRLNARGPLPDELGLCTQRTGQVGLTAVLRKISG